MTDITINSERLTSVEYIDFLKRTDLGSQYPQERFAERIERLLEKASISLTARNEIGQLIGICFCITDFAYWLFITDLGIDRDYIKQGIGTKLVQRAIDLAGGTKDIIVYTCANENAIPFYEKLGMKPASSDVMQLHQVDWTSFTVK